MTTWYINADTGDDGTGNGSAIFPWKTLLKAHTSATTNDTVTCQDSTAHYLWETMAFSKNLIVQGVTIGGSGAIFDAAGVEAKWTTSALLSFLDLRLSNNIISIASAASQGAFSASSNLLSTFSRCHFYDITLGALNGKSHVGLSIWVLLGQVVLLLIVAYSMIY
jgi:hypothetical protein